MNLERRLEEVGQALADGTARGRLAGLIRGSAWVTCLAYVACLAALLAALRLSGEANVTTAFLLFLPRATFLLPLVLLLPLALIVSRRLALVLSASCAAIGLAGSGLPLRLVAADGMGGDSPPALAVLSYNRGQHQGQSLQPFKELVMPDVIALQEAPGRAEGYEGAEGYEEFVSFSSIGEHSLLSRYPIVAQELVGGGGEGGGGAFAARFVIDFGGRAVAIYSVHLPTPRGELRSYRRGAFLWGVLGLPGTPWAEKRRGYQGWWDERIGEARELLQRLEAEELPALVVGDFNAPAGGYIHGLLRGALRDAHLEAGVGLGYTFPGTTRNPLSGGGPWMRIDYLFCDRHWEVEWCVTERERPSQHRAVAAGFRLRR